MGADLVTMGAIIFDGEDLGATWTTTDIADIDNSKVTQEMKDELLEKADKYREELVELAVEQDDDLMMSYLEGEEPTTEQLKACIRKGTLALDFVPVLTGTAFKNKGVQALLDAVIDYMPAPIDVQAIKGTSV